MSALELMDPKMDPGMRELELQKEGKQAGPKYDLTDGEMVAVMDKCLAAFVAWCSGHSLAHTILTCTYTSHESRAVFQAPAAAGSESAVKQHPMLGIFVRTLLILCAKVREVVRFADVYDEEDFMPNLFGCDIPDEKSSKGIVQEIRTAEEAFIKSRGGGSGGKAKSDGKSGGVCEAIVCRLRLFRDLMLLHDALGKRNGAESKAYILRVEKNFKSVRATQKFAAGSAPGFDPSVPYDLVPNMPPRVVEFPNAIKTMLYFIVFIKQAKYVLPLCGSKLPPIDEVQLYFKLASVQRPGIVLRSHMLMTLNTDSDFLQRGPLSEQLKEVFLQFSPTFELTRNDPDLGLFLNRISRPICHIFRLFCENRARQRRKIKKLLPDWNVLAQDALVLDKRVHDAITSAGLIGDSKKPPCRSPCFSLVFEITCMLLQHHILLGFELELFAPREYISALFYLEYIINFRIQGRKWAYSGYDIQVHKKVHAFLSNQQRDKDQKAKPGSTGKPAPGGSSSGKRSKRKKRSKRGGKTTAKLAPMPVMKEGQEFILLGALRDVCSGTYKLLGALRRSGAWEIPPLLFGSDKINFQQRFLVFHRVQQPKPLDYDDYLKHTQIDEMPMATLMGRAHQSFENGKLRLNFAAKRPGNPFLPDGFLKIRPLLKVATANAATVVKLNRALEAAKAAGEKGPSPLAGKYRIEIDFNSSGDRSIPIVKLLPLRKKALDAKAAKK